MNTTFYTSVAHSTAHRKSREDHALQVVRHPELLPDLFTIAFDTQDKIHHKACWILELVLENDLRPILPFLDRFCKTIPLYTSDPAIRSISKICLFLASSKTIFLNPDQEQQIIETCFDWLIQDEKVAAKAYAMRALFRLGKKFDWIHPELKTILSQDYTKHSAAYKAAAKDLLKQIA